MQIITSDDLGLRIVNITNELLKWNKPNQTDSCEIIMIFVLQIVKKSESLKYREPNYLIDCIFGCFYDHAWDDFRRLSKKQIIIKTSCFFIFENYPDIKWLSARF